MIQAIPSSRDLLVFDCRTGRSKRELVDLEIPLMSGFLNLKYSAVIAGGLRNGTPLREVNELFRNQETALRLPSF